MFFGPFTLSPDAATRACGRGLTKTGKPDWRQPLAEGAIDLVHTLADRERPLWLRACFKSGEARSDGLYCDGTQQHQLRRYTRGRQPPHLALTERVLYSALAGRAEVHT